MTTPQKQRIMKIQRIAEIEGQIRAIRKCLQEAEERQRSGSRTWSETQNIWVSLDNKEIIRHCQQRTADLTDEFNSLLKALAYDHPV